MAPSDLCLLCRLQQEVSKQQQQQLEAQDGAAAAYLRSIERLAEVVESQALLTPAASAAHAAHLREAVRSLRQVRGGAGALAAISCTLTPARVSTWAHVAGSKFLCYPARRVDACCDEMCCIVLPCPAMCDATEVPRVLLLWPTDCSGCRHCHSATAPPTLVATGAAAVAKPRAVQAWLFFLAEFFEIPPPD
jgi:hypothetical protein